MLRSISRHLLQRSGVAFQHSYIIRHSALRGESIVLPIGSASPLLPRPQLLNPIVSISSRSFSSSTQNKGPGGVDTQGEESKPNEEPLKNNQTTEDSTTTQQSTENVDAAQGESASAGQSEKKEEEDFEVPTWRKQQQGPRAKTQSEREREKEREEAKKITSGSVYFIFGLIGVGLLVVAREGYNFFNTVINGPRWIPNLVVQRLLIELIPSILNNATLIREYGPINVQETSITFQQFGQEKMVVTFLIYQQVKGARIGTVYIDLEKGEDEHMRVQHAYMSFTLGGPPLEFELDPELYDFDLKSPKFGEEGAYELMQQQRDDELKRSKEMQEMEERERERMVAGPLRGLIK